ncbi:bifunctional enoyl-CoA hydratase/phosphate acetyltransferase [Salinisphaera hydrothermalis]|uniref:bifunctional enoyl-CoA hydratase/phosphate acetyltransferase n=1 Tax=Salinisphaera hydrothermalis TaxID=563188 RepID=UPI003DA6F99D
MKKTLETASGHRLNIIIKQAKDAQHLATAVVQPSDPSSLSGALDAMRCGLIEPILVGREAEIRTVADAHHLDIEGVALVDAGHDAEASQRGVDLVRTGRAHALMKGNLHTDAFMRPIVARGGGLRTARRMSHVFVLDTPAYSRLLLITDAAINIAPDLSAKRDITQNAIDLARAIGIDTPRAAIVCAVETVTPALPSTCDAAALCKMADRNQIEGGLLDGPLAFDNAVSPDAVRAKGIVSAVAGQADILVVPDLEAGNMLAKQIEYLAGAHLAGVVVGARVPIMLTSRADSALARLASCAVAALYRQWQLGRTGIE